MVNYYNLFIRLQIDIKYFEEVYTKIFFFSFYSFRFFSYQYKVFDLFFGNSILEATVRFATPYLSRPIAWKPRH